MVKSIDLKQIMKEYFRKASEDEVFINTYIQSHYTYENGVYDES